MYTYTQTRIHTCANMHMWAFYMHRLVRAGAPRGSRCQFAEQPPEGSLAASKVLTTAEAFFLRAPEACVLRRSPYLPGCFYPCRDSVRLSRALLASTDTIHPFPIVCCRLRLL